MCSDVGHSVRVAQIICERTAAKDGEKDAERYLHNKSDDDRRQRGSDDGCSRTVRLGLFVFTNQVIPYQATALEPSSASDSPPRLHASNGPMHGR